MEKTVRSFFLTICLVLSAFMPTAVYAVTVPVNSEDEYDYELAEGIFYTGETAKRHVPGGYGTLTFRTSDPSGVPDIVIAGTFEGDRIRNAVLCQSEELLFWGEMRYSVNQKKGSYIVLVKGEIFDGEGNLTGEVTEDSPLTINCLSGNPAYLKGSGPIKRHVDPVSASRYVLLSGNGIESGSSTLEVEGKSWKVSPEEFRFKWGEYTFGIGDYSKGIGKEVSFGETATSQYTISEELDAFAQIWKIEGNDLLSVLRYMSASVPMTGKGFKYYTSDRGLTAHVHEKDYVYQENGGWCFETSLPVVGPMEMVQNREYGIKSDQYGLYGFFGSKNQLYSMPFEVCISRPSYELTCKISRDKLTFISVGTIQMQGETDTYMNPVAPPVTPFSVKDLVFGNREGAAGGGGTLSEGASHTVTLPFLGVETAWTVSATTKEWVTPISTAGTSIIVNGRKYSEAGDAFPPFRAVRTVTQSVDLKDVAQKKGWTVQLLMEQLFETGLDGLIATSKSDIIRIGKGAGMKDGVLRINPEAFREDVGVKVTRPWSEHLLAAAAWKAGGFTTPEDAFDVLLSSLVKEDASTRAGLFREWFKGRDKVLEYCAGEIEKASSLEELATVFSEIYPIARLDDLSAVRDLSRDQLGSLFLSGLFFSTAGTDAGSDAAGRAFSKRVRDKLTALLSKESGPLKDEFLAAVEAFAARRSPRGACTYDNSQIPGHPIPEVRAALEKGSRAKAMTAFFLAPSLERGLERLPRLDQEQKGIVMRSLTEGIEASISSIRNDIKRDYACNDPEQVMKDIDFLMKVNTALRQTEEFYDLADDSFVQSYREKAQRLQSYQEEDRISIERNQPSATLYLSQKYASAPKVQESKEFIRGYFGLEPERTLGRGFTSEPQVVLSPYSDWAEWMKEPSRKITPEQSGRVTGDFVYKLHSSCRIVIEDTDILRLVGVTETSSSHDAAFEVVCPGETRVFFIYPNSGKYSVLNVHAER